MKLSFKSTTLLFLFLVSTMLFITSCQKETSQTGTDDEQQMEASRVSGEGDTEAEFIFDGTFNDVMGVNDEVGIGGTGVFGRINACPTVTFVQLNAPNRFPLKVTLDFGVTGCTAPDGHFRKGKVVTTYSHPLLLAGATATTEFVDFYFDSTKVEGRHIITNNSTPVPPGTAPIDRKFTVKVIDGKLTKPNGNFVAWNSTKTITQIEGLHTIIHLDDIFKVEGHASGNLKRGALLVRWESNIIEPLIKRFNCRWIVRGKIRTIRANIGTNSPWIAVLDFGAGTCDNRAVLTINGIPHQITLP